MIEIHGINLAATIKQNSYLFLVFLESNQIMDVRYLDNDFFITIINRYKDCQD